INAMSFVEGGCMGISGLDRMLRQSSSTLSRRDFAGLALGSAAGAWVGLQPRAWADEGGGAGQKKDAPPASTGARLAEPVNVAALEKIRGRAIGEDQRQRVAGRLKQLSETINTLRKHALHDGGSEPCTTFSAGAGANATTQGAPKEGGSGG